MEVQQMARRSLRIVAVGAFVCILADVALADILPSPFDFSFFTPGLTNLFLLPFSLAGCS
jgi:hypothetical protein